MSLPLGALISSPEWKTLLRPNGLLRHPNTLDILPITGHLNILEDDAETLADEALEALPGADAVTAATFAPGRNISVPALS